MKHLKKTGIMGGTFNPIHMGHLIIAETAREQFALDEVLFLPSGVPYMKDSKESLPGKIRMEMTGLAIRENPFLQFQGWKSSEKGALIPMRLWKFFGSRIPIQNTILFWARTVCG